jgi:6-phosphogluconolactonase
MKRRAFLAAGSLSLPFVLRSIAEDKQPHWIYLSTDLGPGIYRAPWNAETGEVGALQVAAKTARPTFFALHPDGKTLYATNELEKGAVSAFRLHPVNGKLEQLGSSVATNGDSPCYVSVDPSGSFAFAANYNDGTLCALPLASDGGLKQASEMFAVATFPDSPPHGPVEDRQAGPHMHSATIFDGHLFACDLGDDAIFIFPLDRRRTQPLGKPLVTRVCKPGSGPRHVAVHPNGRWIFGVTEMGCTVVRYTWAEGRLTPVCDSEVSSLSGWTKKTGSAVPTVSEVAIEGQFLYVATRGADVLAVFRIDPASGALQHVQTVPCGGITPRHFAVAPGGKFLLCANQGTGVAGSGNLTAFRRDGVSGRLELLKVHAADTPMFVQFV